VIPKSVAANLVSSRLLVLQSNRLLLNSSRHIELESPELTRERVERLRRQTQRAQENYRRTVLHYGSPSSSDYWQVAYGRLIERGAHLRSKLSSAVDDLPAADRYAVSTDIEVIDQLLSAWTESFRGAVAGSVA
jgi:hypothetical protein